MALLSILAILFATLPCPALAQPIAGQSTRCVDCCHQTMRPPSAHTAALCCVAHPELAQTQTTQHLTPNLQIVTLFFTGPAYVAPVSYSKLLQATPPPPPLQLILRI